MYFNYCNTTSVQLYIYGMTHSNITSVKTRGLDQFYTNPDVAVRCYHKLASVVDMNQYDIHLEPSAGSGSFFTLMDHNKRVGIDKDPKTKEVTRMDFFDYQPVAGNRYMVVGNPPFGKISSLAIQFFNKSAEFAGCIAFIIPRTFKRVSVQNRLDVNFHLLYSEDLPVSPCCFTPPMSAKCCFQIWVKKETPRHVVCYDKSHPDFTFQKHGPLDNNHQPTAPKGCDFALKAYGSNCGSICDKDLHSLRPKSWHWIKANIDPDVLKHRLSQIDYSMSKDTVRQDSIGQQELIYLYKRLREDQDNSKRI